MVIMKIDPIIAVRVLESSSKWYQSVLDCRISGQHIVRLVSEDDEILLCLHNWGEHEHPTMKNPNIIPGNGLILYFRTENLDKIRQNVEKCEYTIEEDIHVNPNSSKKEFSLRDPDGYYLTISEFHKYES